MRAGKKGSLSRSGREYAVNPPDWLADPEKRDRAALSGAQAIETFNRVRGKMAKPVAYKVPPNAGKYLERSLPKEKEE